MTHPHLDTILAHAGARGIAPADPLTQPLAEARASALAYQAIWNENLPEMAAIERVTFVSPLGAPLALRIFRPSARHLPVLVYFHGGGFALNGLDTHERLMRLLALRAGIAVVGVGYSLAPELRFPGQLDEALAAIAWVRDNAAAFGLDGGRLAVGGDSAGANLALAATLALRDRGHSRPDAGLLFYGMFSADLASPSQRAYGGGGFGLTTERVDWFWHQYLADFAQRDNPLAAPLHADFAGLPPQLVIGAGLDCLLDDSLGLARRLDQAGVPHTLSVYAGVPHSFMQMSAILPPADAAITQAAEYLRHLFGVTAQKAA
jgi:acetyl esterase